MLRKTKAYNFRDRRVLDHFITAQGKIRGQRLTKVSTKQHRAITKAIKKSRILARLPFMLSGILERKIYSEELRVVALDSKKGKKFQKVFSTTSSSQDLSLKSCEYEPGSYPVTVARLEKKAKISRRTRIRTFAQVRLGLREDIRYQYMRVKSKSTKTRNRRGTNRGAKRTRRQRR
jgi:ribosomal protein S18